EDRAFRSLLGGALGAGAAFEGDGARWTIEPVGVPTTGLDALETAVSRAEQSNTSVRYGDRAMLKLFRRLEHGEHPDVEIGTFLTTRTTFQHTPSVLGVTHYCDAAGATYVTGMLSRFVVGARDGWAIALDEARAALRSARADGAASFASEASRIGRTTRGAPSTTRSHSWPSARTRCPNPARRWRAPSRAAAPRRSSAWTTWPSASAHRSRRAAPACCARPGTTATTTWASCCAAKRACGSSSTSRASHRDRCPSAAGSAARCAMSRACCDHSPTQRRPRPPSAVR